MAELFANTTATEVLTLQYKMLVADFLYVPVLLQISPGPKGLALICPDPKGLALICPDLEGHLQPPRSRGLSLLKSVRPRKGLSLSLSL